MLGKKKENKDDLPEFEQGETTDAKIMLESKQKLLDFTATEFKEQYAGVFDPKAIEEGKIDTEAMSLDLLFAIYSELRIMRELRAKR